MKNQNESMFALGKCGCMDVTIAMAMMRACIWQARHVDLRFSDKAQIYAGLIY